jgi:hypothetical protein
MFDIDYEVTLTGWVLNTKNSTKPRTKSKPINLERHETNEDFSVKRVREHFADMLEKHHVLKRRYGMGEVDYLTLYLDGEPYDWIEVGEYIHLESVYHLNYQNEDEISEADIRDVIKLATEYYSSRKELKNK